MQTEQSQNQTYKEDLKKYYNDRVASYASSYKGGGRYPSNYYRLQIVLKLLSDLKNGPGKILDAGCGDARVLKKVLESGYQVVGFDNSIEMLKEGKRTLQEAGFEPEKIYEGDIYQIPAKDASFDTILCLGVLSNLPNHDIVFREFTRVLKPGGTVIFSLTNQLFDLFTFNKFTIDMISKLMNEADVSKNVQKDVSEKLSTLLGISSITHVDKIFEDKQIDKSKVTIEKYNQLNLAQKLEPRGFQVEKVRHYHYHPIPTRFESEYPEIFIPVGEAMETVEYDWKGALMCSALVAQAKKMF